MGIQFSCGGCGAGFSVNNTDVGRLCKCNDCGTVMRVPRRSAGNHFDTGEPSTPAPSESAPAFSAPARGPAAPPIAPGATAAASRPSLDLASLPSTPRSRGFSVGHFRLRIVTLFLALGAVLTWFGVRETKLAAASSATPQPLSCRDLALRGPGANAYVTLTDFVVARNGAYYKRDQDQSDWSTIWLPLLPRGTASSAASAGKRPSALPLTLASRTSIVPTSNTSGIRVLLKSTRVRTQADLPPLYYLRKIEGMIVNCVDSVGPKEMEILRAQYPGTDFAQCWILEEGRKPTSPVTRFALFCGGGFGLLAALAVLCWRAGE